MNKFIYLTILILTSGCATVETTPELKKTNTDIPISHTPIKSSPSVYYFDLSAGDRCLLKEEPHAINNKLSLKPVLDKDGNWQCETKDVVYKVRLSVKNTDNITKDFELLCNNPYGLMKDCKGWGAWTSEMGPGPYVIDSKGSPEIITNKFPSKK